MDEQMNKQMIELKRSTKKNKLKKRVFLYR